MDNSIEPYSYSSTTLHALSLKRNASGKVSFGKSVDSKYIPDLVHLTLRLQRKPGRGGIKYDSTRRGILALHNDIQV